MVRFECWSEEEKQYVSVHMSTIPLALKRLALKS